MSATAAGLMLSSFVGTAVADGNPESGSVTCTGNECTVVATGSGNAGGTGSAKPVGATQPGTPTSPSPGNWSELAFLTGLYQSGLTATEIADLYGRAVVALDPQTGQPLRWLASANQQGSAGGPGAPVVVTPAQLAQVAVSRLRLPVPVVGTSPSGEQVVRVPTWLWVDRSGWGPVSATAAVPGVSVTATAVPVSVVWSMGTGDSVTCSGPGTPYGSGVDPASSSPDCGYTYVRSSAGESGERFAVSVTVSWRVSWVGGGQSGAVEGLSTRAGVDLRVREVQAVIVNP